MLNPRDIEDLEWFFEPRPTLGGGPASPLGAQLALASTRYRDSSGKTIPVQRIVTVTRELSCSGDKPAFARYPTPWAYTFVSKEKPAARAPQFPDLPEEVSLEDSEEAVSRRQARRERELRLRQRLGRLSNETWTTLATLYGPTGRFWSQRPQGRRWPLLGLTRKGAQQLAQQPDPHEARWLLELAHHSPKPPWLSAALTQAERLEAQAASAWRHTLEARPSP